MSQKTPSPPRLTQRLVRYILGFGVSFAIGLAPFLGKVNVPLFEPVLNLIPRSLQGVMIPLSAAFMGIVAVAIQWYGGENVTREWLRRWFKRTLALAVLTLLALAVVHAFVVVRVEYLGGSRSESFLVGFSRAHRPPCPAEVSDSECIKRLTFDRSKIESFWGDRQVRVAWLLLMLTYIGFTSCFGLAVGLLLIRDESSDANGSVLITPQSTALPTEEPDAASENLNDGSHQEKPK